MSSIESTIGDIAKLHGETQTAPADRYHAFVERLASGAELTAGEKRELARAMLDFRDYDGRPRPIKTVELDEHITRLKFHNRSVAERDRLKREAEELGLPTVGKINAAIAEFEREITPKISELLEPKRVLERQLIKRREIDEGIRVAQESLNYTSRQVRELGFRDPMSR